MEHSRKVLSRRKLAIIIRSKVFFPFISMRFIIKFFSFFLSFVLFFFCFFLFFFFHFYAFLNEDEHFAKKCFVIINAYMCVCVCVCVCVRARARARALLYVYMHIQ
jgi:hypothetical protein